jgi:sugar lactone lactonase YvrE
VRRSRLLLALLAISLFCPPGRSAKAQGGTGNLSPPTRVWGQPNFVSDQCLQAGARTLCGPAQVVRDSQGNLWVADLAHNRVVMYPSSQATASKVFGQYGSFITSGCDQRPPRSRRLPPAPSRYTLCQPTGVAVDQHGTLYVADSINNRVLVYFHASQKPSDAPADRVLGQASFHATGSNDVGKHADGSTCPAARPASQCTLNGPMELNLDLHGDLLVPDYDNHRVLLWSAESLAVLESRACSRACVVPASHVWGQYGSFATNNANNPNVPSQFESACTTISLFNPASACTLSGPWAALTDSRGDLFVSDTDNNRLLNYDQALTTNRQDADAEYGQAGSLRTVNGNRSGISASSLWHPIGLALDPTGDLWTTDFYNRRVLEFPAPNGAGEDRAIQVLGQNGRFNTKKCGIGRQGLCGPTSISFDVSGNAYVVDGLNSRVLEYTTSGT